MNTTHRPWTRALTSALATIVVAAGLAAASVQPASALASTPASSTAPTTATAASTTSSTATAQDDGLGPFSSLSGDPMDGYRLYEVPTGGTDLYSIDALGPHGEIAGRSRDGSNGNYLTEFVFTPGEGFQWLQPVPWSVNHDVRFDGKGNVYGSAGDGTHEINESVLWKWIRLKDGGYSAPQAILHGKSVGWTGDIADVNEAGDVLLDDIGGTPFLVRGGQATKLAGLSGTDWATVHDLNEKGQAVGASTWPQEAPKGDEPTLWSAGGATSLGYPPLVYENAAAYAINDKGEVIVGDGTWDQDPWLRKTDGSFKLLATVKDAPSASIQRVDALGDDGTAVGFYQPDGSSGDNKRYAAMWTRDGQRVQLLDDLILGGAQFRQWHLDRAFAINHQGMIGGVGTHEGRDVAWIAVPVDPVVFVHGAGASSLDTLGPDGAADDNSWMSCTQSREQLSLWKEDEGPEGPALKLFATDALRHEKCFVFGESVNPALNIYGSFLDRLRGNYTEYERHQKPALQTEAGCDTSQMDGAKTPNLFVYAYDWRADNRKNAEGLTEYIKCVHKFWPGRKVDIVTHSMGSLVARRYLLQQGGGDVDRMITIGAPWLGAPKLVNVLQTGDFAPQPVNGPREVIKHVVGSFPAAHELAASRVYAAAAKLPIMSEMGWDLNGNGNAWDDYSYDKVKEFLDSQNKRYNPGTTGDEFQNENGLVGGQTDWRHDTSGIAFTHIVGLQAGANTIGSVVAMDSLECTGLILKTCKQAKHFEQILVCGDGTVPYVSAERAGKGVDYNAPDAEVLVVRSDNTDSNAGAEHTGMAANHEIQDTILRRLFDPMKDADGDGHRDPVAQDHSGLGQPGDDLESCYQQPAPDDQGLAASSTRYGSDNPAPGTGMRYVSVVGGTDLEVTDSAGKTTDPQGSTGGYVAGVTQYPSDRPDAGMVTFPESDTRGFTTSFTGTGDPVQLKLLEGSQTSPTRALRWIDVPVADGQAARLRATADGREVFEVDKDGDGTPETPVAPTAKVGGSDAADITAPEVTATRLETAAGVRFGLAATDGGSGVGDLMWSTDGTHFQRYDGLVAAEPGTHLTAFATDRAGNRSAPYEFDVDDVKPGLFTTATVSPAPSDQGWTAGTGTVTLQTQAPLGTQVASITYRTSGAAGDHEQTVAGDSAELEVKAVGTTTVTYFATAVDGTKEPARSAIVRIDQAAPVAAVRQPTPMGVVSNLPAIKGTASDDASGVTGVEIELRNAAGQYWDGDAWTGQQTWIGASGTTTWSRTSGLPQGADLGNGAYRVQVRASDGAGHSAVVATSSFTVAPTVATTARPLTVSSGSITSGVAVNEHGVALGITAVAGGNRVVRWTNGREEVLPVTGSAVGATARAVDDAGRAYGSQSDSHGLTQPVRWGVGSEGVTVLPAAFDGGNGQVADATGDGSILVGWSAQGPGQPQVPVRWVDGRVEQLPLTAGATAGEATGVAADGTVVGTLTTPSGRRAVLWPADGGVRNLGTLPNHVSSTASGINDLDVVVGTSTDSNGWVSGFTYADGEMRALDKVVFTRHVYPIAIDNAGTIVGEYFTAVGGGGPGDKRAFITGDEGWVEDLTDRLPAGSGWTLTSARGVNQLGQVVGFGAKDGRSSGFLVGPAHAPLTDDQVLSTPKDTAVSLRLAGFDPDVTDPVTYEVVGAPKHGSVGAIVAGEITYTPDEGYQGTDTFTWRMSDPEYGSVPATVTITVGEVKPDPEPDPDPDPTPDYPPTITVTAPRAGDEGATVALHATAADPEGADLHITWSATGGVVTGSGADVTLTLPDGPDTVTVSASTTDGAHPVTATAAIDVRNVPPTVDAGADVTVLWGVPVTLKGSVTDPSGADTAAGFSPAWTFGDGGSATGTDRTHTWAAPGSFTATLTAADKDGATAADSATVRVTKHATVLKLRTQDGGFGFATVTATVTDSVSSAASPNRTVIFSVDGKVQPPVISDITGTARLPLGALLPGAHTVSATVAEDARFLGASAAGTTVKVTNSPGKATGQLSVMEGSATFSANSDGKTAKGSLTWTTAAGTLTATVNAIGIGPDGRTAWIAGTAGKRSVLVYVEDNGESGVGDVFRLFVDGTLQTAIGTRTSGNLQVHKS